MEHFVAESDALSFKRSRNFAGIIPGKQSTYIFQIQKEYYEGYKVYDVWHHFQERRVGLSEALGDHSQRLHALHARCEAVALWNNVSLA